MPVHSSHVSFIKTGLVLFLLASTSVPSRSADVIMPPHPRLLVTPGELPAIQDRLIHPDYAPIKRQLLLQANYVTTGVARNNIPDELIRRKMEALALAYLVDPISSQASGEAAISLALTYLRSITSVTGWTQNIYCYESVFGAALVYDWCYELLTAEEKTELIAQMKRVCGLAEYSPEKGTSTDYLTGHYAEVGPSIFLAVGIATYDEDQQYFDFAYNEQVKSFAPTRNPMYEAGTHYQGAQYIHVRYFSELLQAFMLEKIGLNPYSPKIPLPAYRGIYDMIPQVQDMDGMPEGDCHNRLEMGYFPIYNLAAQMSRDPFLQIFSKAYLGKSNGYSARAFIFHDPEVPAEDLSNLSLSRYFPSPAGMMIARTGWDVGRTDYRSRDMVVLMNMREYSAKNHVHLDVGHFSIYYKGHLALDSGIYQGSDPENQWGGENYVNYYTRTVAHNSLLILDPDEPYPYEGWNTRAKARDGGQFSLKNSAFKTSQEMFEAGKLAQILAHDIADGVAPDYSYLKGDMTRAYAIPRNVAVYPAKVETVRRSFVFLNLKSTEIPGALIVMDRVVSTNPAFRKTWLLHSQNEPVITAGRVEFASTQSGRNGKLRNDVLLPVLDNQRIEKIGGPGREYWVDGKNWGSVTQEDAGEWRIELSPKAPSTSDNFLNVMQVMDAEPAGTPFAVDMASATKGGYVALSISDRIVAQQTLLDRNAGEVDFTIGDPNRDYKILVTDLKAGIWEITSSSGKTRVPVSPDSGVACFSAKGGRFVLTLDGEAGARLLNLSVRAEVAANQTLTMGMVMRGGARDVLARAGGPALASFGVQDAMTDPQVQMFAGDAEIAANDDWSAALRPVFTTVGAFDFPIGSKDAALVQTIDGPATVKVRGKTGGTTIAESYLLGTGVSQRLTNLSALHYVGFQPLIAGFVIGGGEGSIKLLIRGVGPGLTTYGVPNALMNPQIRIFRDQTELAGNDNWTADLGPNMTEMGAFALPIGSSDAALMISLQPGAYTVHLTGANHTTGNAIVELYTED